MGPKLERRGYGNEDKGDVRGLCEEKKTVLDVAIPLKGRVGTQKKWYTGARFRAGRDNV